MNGPASYPFRVALRQRSSRQSSWSLRSSSRSSNLAKDHTDCQAEHKERHNGENHLYTLHDVTAGGRLVSMKNPIRDYFERKGREREAALEHQRQLELLAAERKAKRKIGIAVMGICGLVGGFAGVRACSYGQRPVQPSSTMNLAGPMTGNAAKQATDPGPECAKIVKCNDGTMSCNQGSGTCSSHGGVEEPSKPVKRDLQRAPDLQTGPRGGKYYVSPGGKKIYTHPK